MVIHSLGKFSRNIDWETCFLNFHAVGTYTISKILLLLMGLMWLEPARSQENFLFERINMEDGLSNNSINCILQTRDGFLWVATKDGLNRYDGQGFKVYKYRFADPKSLPENYVMSLFESSSGTLWVGTWGAGLCRYDAATGQFFPYRLAGSSDNYIQCLFEDHDKNIWFGTTEGGLFKLRLPSGEITNFSSVPGLDNFPSNNITSIAEDSSNQLWIGTWDSGLVKFDPASGNFARFTHNPTNDETIASNGVWNVMIDSDEKILLSTFSGIDCLNPKNGRVIHNPEIPQNFRGPLSTAIRQTVRDRKGRLWIGTYDYNGLFLSVIDGAGQQKFFRFINEDDNQQSISIDRIRWIFEDLKGNIWIGTENGLNKLPVHQPFKQYRYLPRRPESLGGRVVCSILEDQDNCLWVGYGGGGFDKIDPNRNQITNFKHELASRNSLSDNDVNFIYQSSDRKIWVCTTNGGLNQFDPVSGSFKIFKTDEGNPNSIPSNWVQQVLETSGNIFLVATNSGLEVYDSDSETFSPFIPEIHNGGIILPAAVSVNALFEDSRGNIWIGTWLDGIYCYTPQSKMLIHYLHLKNDPNSIGSNKITTIFEDSRGSIWFGTHSGGLNRFSIETGKFKQYNTENGFPNDVVFGILEDSKAYLWISTLNGLVKFHPETGVVRVYDILDGLVDNQFNWRASFKNKEGAMYFGGINGFVFFHPDSIKVDTVPPLVALTTFNIFPRKATAHQKLPVNNEIILRHNQNFFSIEFTALDMAPNQKHKYAYMLEGIDPDWVYSGERTTAFYTDLRHGSFRFLTKASNADDVWSNPASLSVIILPAWWNTWWIKVLGVLAVFGVGLFVARIRFWYLLELERIRLNIASDLHDEMGSNLSSISVDSQQLMRSRVLDKKSLDLASDIYKTTNETIDSIRDIIWFISPKNDKGENTVFKMKEKASSLLAGLNWSFDAAEDIRLDNINLETRRNLFLIYKESLTNVVRHSEATECSIKLYVQKGKLHMSICDNGKGFDLQGTQKLGGLGNIYHRAKKINAGIDLVSQVGNGTCLNLDLPFKT